MAKATEFPGVPHLVNNGNRIRGEYTGAYQYVRIANSARMKHHPV
jgi:hypothetical protein